MYRRHSPLVLMLVFCLFGTGCHGCGHANILPVGGGSGGGSSGASYQGQDEAARHGYPVKEN